MKIPAYPESRALQITDKTLLDRIFAELQPRVSELTFAGLYLFRFAHDYRLTLLGDSLAVLGRGYDGASYCLPPLGGDVLQALTTLLDDGQTVYGADDQFLKSYCSVNDMIISEERDSFDYLYLREELALLPGKRFHKKKNRVNYFKARHHYQVLPYSDTLCSGCLNLLSTYRSAAGQTLNPSLEQELFAASEALSLTDQLGLEGIVISVDGEVAGFALGERLNHDTAVCHFEKADSFKEGLAQLINQEFAKLLFGDCRYINREQDLGEAGLRNAKLSYHPLELVKKYKLSRLRS